MPSWDLGSDIVKINYFIIFSPKKIINSSKLFPQDPYFPSVILLHLLHFHKNLLIVLSFKCIIWYIKIIICKQDSSFSRKKFKD